MTISTEPNPYVNAYPFLVYRKGVWREIIRVIQKDSGHPSSVIELGAGYCDFMNQFPAEKKIVFDLNPEMQPSAEADVDFRVENAISLPGIADRSIDLIFASNFLEHLELDEIHNLFSRIESVLKSGGKLILIQPNYRLCSTHYFDDPTHKTIFSDENMADFFTSFEFDIIKIIPGFLPFSMKSVLPKWPFLVRLYLLSPFKPFAAQMYIVAERR